MFGGCHAPSHPNLKGAPTADAAPREPDAEIATAARRHRSTIYRELKRNWRRDAEVPQSGIGANAEGPATPRPQIGARACPALGAAVVERLKDRWSPEQIVGRLKLDGRESQEIARRSPERRRVLWSTRGHKPKNLVFSEVSRIRSRVY